MPIIDGVKYNLHVFKDEKEFKGLVKEHFSEIFLQWQAMKGVL